MEGDIFSANEQGPMENLYELPDDAKTYLEAGEQTEITPEIENLTSKVQGTTVEKARQLLEGMEKNSESREFNEEEFMKRTGNEIIESKYYTGCTDFALAFITLARATGIPAMYVETISKEWLERGGNPYGGHVYAKIYDLEEKKWIWVDPMQREIGSSPDKRGRVILAEGKDAWDIGIRDFNTLKDKFNKYREDWISERKE